MCLDEGSVKSFNNFRKDGFFCKTYKVDGVTNGIATVSVDIYDANSNPVKVRSISIETGNQYGSRNDANNHTLIINCENGQKIRTCMDNIIDGIFLVSLLVVMDGVLG
ncbi:hypothetical protein Glove_259g13 [Diversispora epigaea]|uniref:Uncharacterized protein n=1 Tax=Diversispora epigaea TaxID=1348612 RepID=A0A397IC42_9GLOM|nr:hypothetical protein Glove_259g13 [Diversispora epigaea]